MNEKYRLPFVALIALAVVAAVVVAIVGLGSLVRAQPARAHSFAHVDADVPQRRHRPTRDRRRRGDSRVLAAFAKALRRTIPRSSSPMSRARTRAHI